MMSGISSMVFSIASSAVGRFGHAVAGELQVRRVHLAGVLIVLDDEHERLAVCVMVVASTAPRRAEAAK